MLRPRCSPPTRAVDMVLVHRFDRQSGEQILAQAAPTVKRVALELGGKSGADLSRRRHRQTPIEGACMARSHDRAARLVSPPTPDARAERAPRPTCSWRSVRHITESTSAPTDASVLMGPVISAAQRERCERYVALAEEHGGDGGVRRRSTGRRSNGATTSSRPSSICPTTPIPPRATDLRSRRSASSAYCDVDEAVRDRQRQSVRPVGDRCTAADVAAATAVARRLRTGAVNVNTSVFSAYAPSGGYKQSGLGLERARRDPRLPEVKHMAIGELR